MEVLNLSVPLFGLIFIGFIAAKIKPLKESALDWMNFFIIYVALPALFFQLIRKTPIRELVNYKFVLATTGATINIFIFTYLIGRYLFKRQGSVATIQAVAASYANIGYMGPAITLSALGQAALIPTAIIFCFDNAFLFTAVPLLMAISSNKNSSISKALVVAIKQVITHPFIIATIAGIAAAVQLKVPTSINNLLNMLSNAAAPAALFAMGIVIAHRKATTSGLEIPVLVCFNLILHPICVYFFLVMLGPFEQLWMHTAVLMACLPPALNIYVMASDYKVYIQQASSIILLGTILAAFTVTYVLYMIKQNIF